MRAFCEEYFKKKDGSKVQQPAQYAWMGALGSLNQQATVLQTEEALRQLAASYIEQVNRGLDARSFTDPYEPLLKV